MLMTTGRDQHQAELERERRRTLSRYTLRAGERRYDVRLTSEPLQLTGELDLLIVDGAIAFPVEFKHTVRPPDPGHRLQLCAYALLVEDQLGLDVPHGYWHSSRTRQTHTIVFDVRLRNRTRQAISAVNAFISTGRCPGPTSQLGKCLECELKNFCGDTV
ncbi:CRISPR-associated protein Cas4 [Deinococcus aquiradiocola]|uniref:CRISPR-associated exonuclease Cas4 n=1 Tax=Deinococcus aquiradiocola TaxID=393059 RepID=A0A917UR25_9DEIO|nr:CRISPR-associated protein Cas4 [Deinococcus aquiradiocola]